MVSRGGGGAIKSADKRSRGRAFSILTTENEEIFVVKMIIIANYLKKNLKNLSKLELYILQDKNRRLVLTD